MKIRRIHSFTGTMLAIASLLWLGAPSAAAADAKTSRSASAGVIVNQDADPEEKVVVKVVTDEDVDARPAKDRIWLGVGVEEASEALADQLGLDSGVGLVVTHVSADSPVAKAGLKKNDVLVELEGQALVHPAQLRKLVQARKPGDNSGHFARNFEIVSGPPEARQPRLFGQERAGAASDNLRSRRQPPRSRSRS